MSSQAKMLVKVKELHEEAAEAALAAAAQAADRALRARDDKESELQRYRQWRPGRERELYAVVTTKPVSLTDLEELNATVAELRARERALGEELVDREQALQTALGERHAAERALQEARKEVQKMTELDQQLSRREALAAERRTEAELEEFHRPPAGLPR